MEAITPNYLLYIIIGVLIIMMIAAIIKRAFKIVVLLILVVLGFSVYNIVVKGTSPIEEAKSYGTDIKYTIAIKDYTLNIKKSVDNIKAALEGSIDENDLKTIKTESDNLHRYKQEVAALEHSSKLDGFHDKYMGYVNTAVTSTDALAKVVKIGENKNVANIANMIKKISTSFEDLVELEKEQVGK